MPGFCRGKSAYSIGSAVQEGKVRRESSWASEARGGLSLWTGFTYLILAYIYRWCGSADEDIANFLEHAMRCSPYCPRVVNYRRRPVNWRCWSWSSLLCCVSECRYRLCRLVKRVVRPGFATPAYSAAKNRIKPRNARPEYSK
jgi:hypothetical protein